MEEFFCDGCATTAKPRTTRVDPTGIYWICERCGAETKIFAKSKDRAATEDIVGIREHMPRGAADT
jgi:hypothetical protein